jgi:hypothetical protein
VNDPMWDLGDLSVEAGFGDDQDRMMEATTMECASSAYSRLALYKTMSDLLWSLWGFIQLANNPREDFLTYSLGRFDRCKVRMGSADFSRHLDVAGTSHRPRTPKHIHRASPERKASKSGQRSASSPTPPTTFTPPRCASVQTSDVGGVGRTPLFAVERG